MKKLIALLLAVSSLAMSTSALAAAYDSFDLNPIGTNVSSEHNGVSRNYASYGTDSNDDPNYSSPVFREDGTHDSNNLLPTYRCGDVLTFGIVPKSGVTAVRLTEGDVLTFICSKYDGSYDNNNVQMIDQIELSPSDNADVKTVYCTYKLRDNLTDGKYKLEMRLYNSDTGNAISKTYVFLIGTPSAELLYVNEIPDDREPTKADKYWFKNGNAYCFGKAVVTGGANFTQTDAEIGFLFDTDGKDGFDPLSDTKQTIGVIRSGDGGRNIDSSFQQVVETNEANNSEIGGVGQYFFRMIIEGVTDVNSLPDVDIYWNK